MKIEFKTDQPVTDAACKKATGKTMKEWFKALDVNGGIEQKRRDAITWLYEQMGKNVWWSTTTWVEYERHKGVVNKKDGRIEGYNICVTKTVEAPLAKVYAAWTEAAALKQWLGKGVSANVEEGGAFKDQDGASGEFLRVRKDKDLRFTWNHPQAAAATLADVTFSDKGKGKTGVMINHQRIQNREEADGLRNAWGLALEALKNLLEG